MRGSSDDLLTVTEFVRVSSHTPPPSRPLRRVRLSVSTHTSARRGLIGSLVAGLVVSPLALGFSTPAQADVSTKISTLPYSQNWSNGALITTSDSWSGVTGIQGYLGDDAS